MQNTITTHIIGDESNDKKPSSGTHQSGSLWSVGDVWASWYLRRNGADWLVGCLKYASAWVMTFLEQRQLIELLVTQIVLHTGCTTDSTAGVTTSFPGSGEREGGFNLTRNISPSLDALGR
jgi:hypothetical protein